MAARFADAPRPDREQIAFEGAPVTADLTDESGTYILTIGANGDWTAVRNGWVFSIFADDASGRTRRGHRWSWARTSTPTMLTPHPVPSSTAIEHLEARLVSRPGVRP